MRSLANMLCNGMSNPAVRDGDELHAERYRHRIANESLAVSAVTLHDIEENIKNAALSYFGRMERVNRDGLTMYADKDAVVIRRTDRYEDRLRNMQEITVSADVLFRLPRRRDLIDHVVDLRAYPVGSSFLSTNCEPGLVVVLMDPKHPMLHASNRHGRWMGSSTIYGTGLPLIPLWQPEYEMTHQEIMSDRYDMHGVPERHKVRMEDSIAKPFYGGAL